MTPRVFSVENACVDVRYMHTGYLQANTYLISDGTATLVVDSAGEVDAILAAAGHIDAIAFTHWHADHTGAARELREKSGAPTIASAVDAKRISGEIPLATGHYPFEFCPIDRTVEHGDTLELGGMQWRVIGSPGHTAGGICLYLDPQFGSNREGRPVLISGDTLFYGSIGRTDFEDSSMDDMRVSLKRLAELPDETIVLPGHNYYTTIGMERARTLEFFAD